MIRQQAGTILVLLLLSACAPLQFGNRPPPAVAETDNCGDVIEFHAAASRLSASDGQEMRQALQPNGGADDTCNRLRLALLLSKPDTPFRDDTEAARLLADFLADPANTQHPQRGLAQQLADSLAERQRLLARQAALKKSLVQEHKRVQALTKKLEQMQSNAASLWKQVKTQQSQLDQLKSIEQDINAKERAVENPASDREEKRVHEPKQNTPR